MKSSNEKTALSYTATAPNNYNFRAEDGTVTMRYIDETKELTNGKKILSRYFYYYTREGMLAILITADPMQPITDNKFYKACMEGITIKNL